MSRNADGERLRTAREAEGWSRPELARRIIAAAADDGQAVPKVPALTDMIKQWERGRHAISARYEALIGKTGLEIAPSRRTFVAAGLGLALATAPQTSADGRVGMSTVDRLRERTVRLRNLDDFLGGADTYPAYAAEATSTIHLLETASYPAMVGRELRRLLSEQLQQAGWAAFDAGGHEQARQHYLDAATAAREADDPVLLAACLAHLGYQASITNGGGVGEATAATETAGASAPAAVRALLLERAAWAYAVQGDEQRTGRALGAAAEALDDERDQAQILAIED